MNISIRKDKFILIGKKALRILENIVFIIESFFSMRKIWYNQNIPLLKQKGGGICAQPDDSGNRKRPEA